MGTSYEQATEEIVVSIEEATEELIILVTIKEPENPPSELFGLKLYEKN